MKPEIKSLIKDFLTSNKITSGMTQEQQTAIAMTALCELVFTDATPAQRAETFAVLYPLMNGSALRQRLESDGLLTKSEGGRKGADPTALAAKWANIGSTPTPTPTPTPAA